MGRKRDVSPAKRKGQGRQACQARGDALDAAACTYSPPPAPVEGGTAEAEGLRILARLAERQADELDRAKAADALLNRRHSPPLLRGQSDPREVWRI